MTQPKSILGQKSGLAKTVFGQKSGPAIIVQSLFMSI